MTNIIRISISEASRLFGISEKTVRRAIKKQEISYIVSGKRYKISFESLVKWSQGKTITSGKLSKNGIGQFVDKWKINNTLFIPRPPRKPDNDETSNYESAGVAGAARPPEHKNALDKK